MYVYIIYIEVKPYDIESKEGGTKIYRYTKGRSRIKNFLRYIWLRMKDLFKEKF